MTKMQIGHSIFTYTDIYYMFPLHNIKNFQSDKFTQCYLPVPDLLITAEKATNAGSSIPRYRSPTRIQSFFGVEINVGNIIVEDMHNCCSISMPAITYHALDLRFSNA